ncbi:MAG: DeoR/GlpR family DNA-binding transcription regulator [Chloroflexota bacterium]
MSKSLIPAQRRRRIREFLEVHQIARLVDLSELLGASEATVRRDLAWLEAQGVVERTHGGAILTQRMPVEPAYSHSAQAHVEEKRRIGRVAAGLVEDGETIFVNSGTTATQVVQHLVARRDLRRLTVITNNVTAALGVPAGSFEVILLGGQFRPVATSVYGHFAAALLRQVSADKAFIGVDGITLKYGCTTPASAEAEIAQGMIERTHGPVVVVADHSKWGVISNFAIAPLEQVHTWVVDDGLALEARLALESRSVRVSIAGPEVSQEESQRPRLVGERSHARLR